MKGTISTCNCNASDRERICFRAGRALPKSINIASGGCPFLRVIRILPGLTSLWAYGGSRLCICLSPAQICGSIVSQSFISSKALQNARRAIFTSRKHHLILLSGAMQKLKEKPLFQQNFVLQKELKYGIAIHLVENLKNI